MAAEIDTARFFVEIKSEKFLEIKHLYFENVIKIKDIEERENKTKIFKNSNFLKKCLGGFDD